ncbi:hypothetical protein AB0756_39955 [Tolypothrix campylonemoides VB511288_2]|uniref:Uncharacterized protein n=2 Tax=Nostocales TaxID=1161 RepID=A0ABW8X1A1_9CYAN
MSVQNNYNETILDKNLEIQERLDDLTTRLQELEERVKHISIRSRN